MDKFIGERLDGRYQIDQLVGTGGMANVYRATDLVAEREVAVKILREEFLKNEELVHRFKNESKAISLLNSENIVKVYDVSITENLQYIVMEFVDGIDFKDYIDQRNNGLSSKETVHFVKQILSAISQAHSKGIIHRDLKPQNIMLMKNGCIKVMDFGIARMARSEQMTITDKAMGSVHYISPEQAKGDTTDHRADIYSIGVMMYEMLTGTLPFDSDTAVGVAIKQISENAIPLREVKDTIPKALEDITLKAMSKDPKDRYQSAGEMISDIEKFIENPNVVIIHKSTNVENKTQILEKVDPEMKKQVSQGGKKAPTPQRAKTPAKKKKSAIDYALPILGGMAVAFAIGAAILVYVIFKFSGNPLFNDIEDISIPNFIGMTETEIMDKVDSGEYKFDFSNIEYNYNGEYAEGVVYDQSPKSPKTVKENSNVTLRVSKGVRNVTVPDVSGYSRSEAESTLSALDLRVTVEYEENNNVAVDTVIRTDPAPQTALVSGDKITIVVSKEEIEREVIVPDLTGLTSTAQISDILTQNKLSLGIVTSEENELPEGSLISQDPAPNTKVKIYSKVNVLVSKGILTRTVEVYINFEDKDTAQWKAIVNGEEVSNHTTNEGQDSQWIIPVTALGGTGEVHLHLENEYGSNFNLMIDVDGEPKVEYWL